MHPAQHERPEPPAAATSSPAFKIEPGRLTLVDPPVRHGFVQPPNGSPAAELKLGTRLRLERERRRITLASIAANTKIGLGLLQGLERNDVSRWPAGIFRRAFIRAYAEAVGLDPDLIVHDFLNAFPDPFDPRRTREAGGIEHAPSGEPLRLMLADAGIAVKRPTTAPLRQRCAAAASDLGVVVLLGLLLFVVLGQFWMALAIAMLAYYATSIVLLGDTPGAALFAWRSSRGREIL
jgi:transcriptional regulator with XRE-family HTH domain